jgi:hypothetical protein
MRTHTLNEVFKIEIFSIKHSYCPVPHPQEYLAKRLKFILKKVARLGYWIFPQTINVKEICKKINVLIYNGQQISHRL